MLKKLDMLRKLGELAQYGVKLSQNYNMSSDYFTMKYEYELHKSIRSKQNSVNWMSSLMLNCIYGVEILNDKYNPFDLKLKNWSEQINADINNYYDVFGEIYEKYNKPGKNMSPELKLILMVSGSALKFHLNNTLLSQPGKIELGNNNNNYIQDPALLEKMRQQAVSDRIRQETEKNNEILRQKAEKEHELVHKQVGDMLYLQQKKQELDKDQQRKLSEFEQMKQFLENHQQPPSQHQPQALSQHQNQNQQQHQSQNQQQHQSQHNQSQHQQQPPSQPSMFNHHNILNAPQTNNADEIRRININSQLNLIRDRVEKIDTDKMHLKERNISSSSSSSAESSVEQKVSSSRKNSKEGNSTYARRKNTKKTISFDTK
jgi:hypothetical protein